MQTCVRMSMNVHIVQADPGGSARVCGRGWGQGTTLKQQKIEKPSHEKAARAVILHPTENTRQSFRTKMDS